MGGTGADVIYAGNGDDWINAIDSETIDFVDGGNGYDVLGADGNVSRTDVWVNVEEIHLANELE